MAYNIPDTYQNTTPASPLDKKTLNKMVWRSLFLQASFNFERMQSCGWLYGILPGLEKIHGDNKDDLAASMSHNLEFFNTHPFLVTFVMGIILSLEQNKTDIPTIRAVRVAAMGPLGGIGDALFWLTLVPIVAGITSNMAINGSIAGPIIFLLVFNVFQFVIRYVLMHWSYKMGTSAIGILTANARQFTRAASILGVFIVGALTCVYGGTSIKYAPANGETNKIVPITVIVSEQDKDKYDDFIFVVNEEGEKVVMPGGGAVGLGIKELDSGDYQVTYAQKEVEPVNINIQEILDGILPKLLPLAITLGLYLLLAKRRFTPVACIGLILVLGIVGGYIGIW